MYKTRLILRLPEDAGGASVRASLE
jgi:hypothetical protein